MSKLNGTELFILKKICNKHEVPSTLLRELLKEASTNAYENKTIKEKASEYRKLIHYQFNKED